MTFPKLLDKYVVIVSDGLVGGDPYRAKLLDMIDQMRAMDPATGKFMRWLGFVHGVMYCLELRTVDEAREDVRACLPGELSAL